MIKNIVFIQAPKDFSKAFTLDVSKKETLFVSIGRKDTANYFKLQGYKIIVFHPIRRLYDPLLVGNLIKLNFFLRSFKKLQFDVCYYFANVLDPFTVFFLDALDSKKIILYDYQKFNDLPAIKPNFYESIYIFLFNFVLGTRSEIVGRNSSRYQKFYIRKKFNTIHNHISKKIEDQIDLDPESVVILEEDLEKNFFDYERTLKEILNILALSNRTIYIKQRSAESKAYFTKKFSLIPYYIPNEFINYDKSNTIFGFTSQALVIPKITTYSLMDLFKFKNKLKSRFLKKFQYDISKQEDGNIKYLQSLSDLKQVLKNEEN